MSHAFPERGNFPAQFRHGSLAVQNQARQPDRNRDNRNNFRRHSWVRPMAPFRLWSENCNVANTSMQA